MAFISAHICIFFLTMNYVPSDSPILISIWRLIFLRGDWMRDEKWPT